MPFDFFMRAFDSNAGAYHYWLNATTPDFTGANAGVNPGFLSNIVVYQKLPAATAPTVGPEFTTFQVFDTLESTMESTGNENDIGRLENANNDLVGFWRLNDEGLVVPIGEQDMRFGSGVFTSGTAASSNIELAGGPTSVTYSTTYGMIIPQVVSTPISALFNFMGTYRPSMSVQIRFVTFRNGTGALPSGLNLLVGPYIETPAFSLEILRGGRLFQNSSVFTVNRGNMPGPLPGAGASSSGGFSSNFGQPTTGTFRDYTARTTLRRVSVNNVLYDIAMAPNDPSGNSSISNFSGSFTSSLTSQYSAGDTTVRLAASLNGGNDITQYTHYIRSLYVYDENQP